VHVTHTSFEQTSQRTVRQLKHIGQVAVVVAFHDPVDACAVRYIIDDELKC
jgi:hypothetical protein